MTHQEINWNEVQILIDRFYEGSTTQEEEQLLMQVMTRDDLPEALHTDAEVFRALANESQLIHAEADVPQGLEERLMESIRQQEQREQLTLVPTAQPRSFRLTRRIWTSIAACLLVVALATPSLLKDNEADLEFTATELTQEEAEDYAAYALSMISTTMKSGMMELDAVSRVQQQVRTTLNDALGTP